MNKKGFTLVELLTIVALLALIVIVAAPNIKKEVETSEAKENAVLNDAIENASKLYVSKYYSSDFINNNKVTFKLSDLESDGLLNLKNGECSDKLQEEIVVEYGNYCFDNIYDENTCYSKKTCNKGNIVKIDFEIDSKNAKIWTAGGLLVKKIQRRCPILAEDSSCSIEIPNINIKAPFYLNCWSKDKNSDCSGDKDIPSTNTNIDVENYEKYYAIIEKSNKESLTANFEYDKDIITLSPSNEVSCTPARDLDECIITLPKVTVNNNKYKFNGWKKDGNLVNANTLVLNNNITLEADVILKPSNLISSSSSSTTKKQAKLSCKPSSNMISLNPKYYVNENVICTIKRNGILLDPSDFVIDISDRGLKYSIQYNDKNFTFKPYKVGYLTIFTFSDKYQVPEYNINVIARTTKNITLPTLPTLPSIKPGSCLAKGTKVKTIDGYKKIENINYDDLVATWSYDLGKIVYEYPLWIEKENISNSYQKITFSDGSSLKTVGFHGIYSFDDNEFISVTDKNKFKVGITVAKIENGNIEKVKVVKIENINKRVKYYHVETTRYYNLISNNILTTDGYVSLTNIYPFDSSNITWKSNQKIINNKNNLYEYEEFSDIIPYYLFSGLRMNEAKYLVKNNVITKEDLLSILKETMLNENITKDMIKKNNIRYWMVTLSTDDISNNKDKYLKKEGSIYTLPKIEDVKYWYNASDNKIYFPGDKVIVNHGMHFTAIN